MTTAVNLGWNGKIYINSSYASPSLTELKNVKGVKISDSFDKDDTTTRADGGFGTEVNTLRKIAASWQMVDKGSGDANLTAIRTAYLAGTVLELFFLDGVATNTSSRGVRMSCQVRKFELDQDNAKAGVYDVEVSPAPSDNAPSAVSGNASWTII